MIEELKNTRSLWKMKLIFGVVFQYNNDDEKVDIEIFIHSINDQTIMLETDSNVFVDDIIKSYVTKYNNIDKQIEGTRFSFEFVRGLSARCDKANEPKGSSYIESPKWLG